MKAQKKLDKILDASRKLVEEEVGALMGVTFKMSSTFNRLTSKEEFFEEQDDKKIVAKIDIAGEIEGTGGLVIGIKDAIRLGGTLIMLPQAELEEVVKVGKYTEEIEDSYGEIANIISGSFTKVFEEMHPKSFRFIRKEQEVVTPMKVDVGSEEPFIDQWYYWVKSAMAIDGVEMGDIDMLIPAELFEIEVPSKKEDEPEVEEETQAPGDPQASAETEEDPEESGGEKDEAEESTEEEPAARKKKEQPQLSTEELKKQKKRIDKILKNTTKLVGAEVGALLGVDVALSVPENSFISKEDFFLEEVSGKQVMARMDVVEEDESNSYFFASLKDAIRLGSILIMLPPAELDAAVSEEEFTPDTEDAYGEVANIVSGVYTQVFQEQYSKNMRFVKTGLEMVAPMKVDTETDEVIPNDQYYMSCSRLSVGDKDCGNVYMLFPVELFNLQVTEESGEEVEQASAKPVEKAASSAGEDEGHPGKKQEKQSAEVLIVENDHDEAVKISEELKGLGISSGIISFSDNISMHVSSMVRLIVIVMREVDEQAYGVTIKVNTQTSAPIIAAGPEWTRSKVIKAVKYGVQDILLTPAEKEDIREKVNSNIMRLAA